MQQKQKGKPCLRSSPFFHWFLRAYAQRKPYAALLAVLCTGVWLPSAQGLEFSGYVRSGIAQTSKGDTQQCFALPGALSKYRLGNECEQLAELDLRHDLATRNDGSVFSVEGMAILSNAYGKTPKFTDEHGYTRLAQGFVSWRHVPWLNQGTLWAGRRYYRRHDFQISDFFYWNPEGTGAGVENARIGSLQLSYAFFRRDAVHQEHNVNRHDFQLGGINTNPNGSLELGLSYIPKPSHAGSHAGWALTAQHTQREVLGGRNVAALQYGKGPGMGLGRVGDIFASRDNSALRVVEVLTWQLGPRFSGQIGAVYQRDRLTNQRKRDWFSVGARPVWALSQQFKLAVELGYDQVKTSGASTAALTKLTIAPTWSPTGGAFANRPDIRLYYTYARWNRAAQQSAVAGSALSSTGSFGAARHGSNIGVQFEHWW